MTIVQILWQLVDFSLSILVICPFSVTMEKEICMIRASNYLDE